MNYWPSLRSWLLPAIVMAAVLAALGLESHIFLFVTFWPSALMLASLALAVATGLFTRQAALVRRSVCGMLILTVGFVGGAVGAVSASRAQLTATFARGEAIAFALERCREVRGDYPRELEDLVPEFLPRIPVTCRGIWPREAFGYRREKGDYKLCFSEGWSFYLRLRDGRWLHD